MAQKLGTCSGHTLVCNWLVGFCNRECIYCAVRTESLNITPVNPSLYPRTVHLCISFCHQWPSRSFRQLCSILPVQCLDCLPMSSSDTRTFWSNCLSATVNACSLMLWEMRGEEQDETPCRLVNRYLRSGVTCWHTLQMVTAGCAEGSALQYRTVQLHIANRCSI
jgi:hypothetical protein